MLLTNHRLHLFVNLNLFDIFVDALPFMINVVGDP